MNVLDDFNRSRALRPLGCHDGSSSPALDVVCRLAADYFQVPIAVVNFISSDQQVSTGRYGVDSHCTALRDSNCSLGNRPCTAAQGFICSPPISADDVLIIEDAGNDVRFSGSPLVAGPPHIRFYAGAPLVNEFNERLGVLFIADRRPCAFDQVDNAALRRFAYLAASELRRCRAELRVDDQRRELDHQESVLAHAQEVASIAMWEWELDTDRVRWSEGVYRLLGSTPASLDTSLEQFLKTVHSSDRGGVDAIVHATRKHGGPINAKFRIVRPDGQVRTLVSQGDILKEDGCPVRAVGVAHDVTDHDQNEAALRASEARWRLALQAGRMIAFDVDLETGTMTLSDHALELIGFTVGQYVDFVNAIHPQDRARVGAALEEAMSKRTPFEAVFRFVQPDGQVVWLSKSGGVAEGGDEQGMHFTGVCANITEYKTLQFALQQNEARFRDLAAISSDWMWETDEDFRFTLNLGGPADTRFGTFNMMGKTRWEHTEADPESDLWKKHIQDHQARLEFRNFEYRIETAEGERWISTSGRPFFDQEGRFLGYRGTATDRTIARNLEAKLLQTQRMEAIGQLSGGIAHDFNNLLTIIMGNAEVLVDRLRTDGNCRPLAATILDAAERGADLTDHLLGFARRQTLEPESTCVNAVIERLVGILRSSLGEHIAVSLSLADDLNPALVDEALLEATLLNLAVNARDAMADGGSLTIETRNQVIEPGLQSVIAAGPGLSELAAGDYVEVSVTDTGVGMEPEVMERVFEPYFSTKADGNGSGLGLPMALGFAKQSGGQITIQSTLGLGTQVRLLLPRAHCQPMISNNAVAINEQPGGTERILVVEDEPEVRAYVVGQLVALGYDTEESANAADALALLQAGRRFDLLFTDVVLAGRMNGIQLADSAKARVPGMKLLFTTGYSEQASALQDVREIGTFLLLKPYRASELAAMVRQAIDS